MQVADQEPVRVVVIDDNVDILTMLRAAGAMTESVIIVGEAADGEEGVVLCAREHPDAVVLDVEMPVMDGIEALPKLRAATPAVKIAMFSSDDLRRPEAERAGADGYFLKLDTSPFDLLDELVTMVRAAHATA